MFDFPRKLVLGLDLSDLSFKMVQLGQEKGRLFLADCLKKEIPAGLVVNGEIKKEEELAELVGTTLKEAEKRSFHNQEVACNLPEEKVFIRIVQLPKMADEEIAQAIKWEAETHIPLGIEEVYLDWQVIEPINQPIDHLDVLFGAVPRDLVDSYLGFLKKSGLAPVALEPESVAVVRSLIRSGDQRPTIIVDLGATGTNFVIFSAAAIRFTSHTAFSGHLLTRAIAELLQVAQSEADRLKMEVGLDKTKEKGKVYQAIEPLIDDLAQQIQNYISFYHNQATHIHGPDGIISQVLLCGGDSLLVDLPSFLSKRLNLPVKLGDPLLNLLVDEKESAAALKKVAVSGAKVLSYTTALGLALRTL